METKDVVAVDKAPVAEKLVRAMEPSRLREGDYVRSVYVADAFDDTLPEDMLKPEYWAHVSAKLRAWDKIEARANDGTWWAEFMVLEAGRNFARVVLMRKTSLTSSDVAQSQVEKLTNYVVKHRGPHCMWSVVRLSDNEVMHEKEGTKGGAEDWLKNHLVALAR